MIATSLNGLRVMSNLYEQSMRTGQAMVWMKERRSCDAAANGNSSGRTKCGTFAPLTPRSSSYQAATSFACNSSRRKVQRSATLYSGQSSLVNMQGDLDRKPMTPQSI